MINSKWVWSEEIDQLMSSGVYVDLQPVFLKLLDKSCSENLAKLYYDTSKYL